MRKKFTILTAALALLAMLAVPKGGWGQSTATLDASIDITSSTSGTGYVTDEGTFVASDGTTWTAIGYRTIEEESIIIGKGGANYLRTPVVNGTITSVAVTWSGNANYYLALQTTSGTELEAKSNPANPTTETFTVSGSYNQLQLVGRRSSGNSNAAATITMVVVTYSTGGNTPSITASDVNIAYNATGGEIAYTINNGVEGGTLTAATTSDWLTLGTVGETVPFTCSANDAYTPRIETVTLTYTYGRNQVTKDLTVTQAAHLPSITVADATVDVGYEGTINTLDVTYDNISEVVAEVYFCNANGEAASYDWITASIVAENNNVEYTVLPNTGAARTAYFKVWAYDNELNEVYSNLVTVNQAVAQVTYSYSINGDLGSSDPSTSTFGATIPLNDGENLNDDFTFAGWTTNPNAVSETERLTGSTTLNAPHTTFYAVYEHTTVTGTTTTASNYVKVTSTDDITDGKYLIVYENGLVAFDGSLETLDVAHNNFSVDIVNNSIEATAKTEVSYFTIASKTGGYSVKSASGKYIGANSYDNQLKTSESDVYTNLISFDSENLVLKVAVNSTQFVTLRFNSANNNDRFRYYKSGQQAIQLYKYTAGGSTPATTTAYYTRVFLNVVAEDDIDIVGPSIIPSGQILNMGENVLTNELGNASFIIEDGAQLFEQYGEVLATVQKQVKGFNNAEEGGWKMIASPVSGTIDIADVAHLNSGEIYKYDEPTHYWRYYTGEQVAAPFTQLANTVGYLYGNENDVTLEFAGTLVPSEDEVTIENLSYTATIGEDANPLAGWNLVGNPFACNAYTTKSYYVTSYDPNEPNNTILGEYAASQNEPIPPCTGILVQATDEDWTISFANSSYSIVESTNNGILEMAVAQQVVNRSGVLMAVKDKAMVSFNVGDELGKFVFNEDNAKLYIPQNGKDYAIAYSNGQGEMPVNFRANTDGQYTLTVNPEGVEMNYLHLIDNMTGANVDLLATPTYTFNASTTDYESRFRLVFSAGTVAEDEAGDTFAYFNGGEWVVSNTGQATLQVVDLTGRILSSETVSGNASKAINATPGIYMLRLISADNVKTQKIVVR